MADFTSAAELASLCAERGWTLSRAMRERELEAFDAPAEAIQARMAEALDVMREAVRQGLRPDNRGMGGLIGGEAAKLHAGADDSVCGATVSRAAAYAMGTLEVNAAMGRIVAAPTAGSSGVLPGVLLAVAEDRGLGDDVLVDALFAAAAVGYLFTRNATVSGARGGCQAEVGVASAMAAAATVELLGGSVPACLNAASLAIINVLGMVCDPVCGLVEEPCQKRNGLGVANALLAAEMARCGIAPPADLDGAATALLRVADMLPGELRETGKGGIASVAGCGSCPGCTT